MISFGWQVRAGTGVFFESLVPSDSSAMMNLGSLKAGPGSYPGLSVSVVVPRVWKVKMQCNGLK